MKYFLGENDRVKLLVLFCGNEEDELLIKAALGTLAILSSSHVDPDAVEEPDLEASERQRLKEMIDHQRIICEKMLNVSRTQEGNKCHLSSRSNRFRRSSNVCARVSIQIFNFVRCTSFGILSK